MDEGDDPYKILGVSRDATAQQIKTAYRKLALRHHPDKQSSEEDRKVATVQFAKISNAYEIVGDEKNRQNFERSQQMDPRWSQMPRHSTNHDFFHRAHFHDPFDIFESFFSQEFGNSRPRSNNGGGGMGGFFGGGVGRRSMFDDPFFGAGGSGDPFGGGSMFNDPFFSGPRGGMMGSNGGFGDPFGSMFSRMNDMMNMQQQMAQQGSINNNTNQQTFVYSSNSSRSLGGPGTESVSTSTTTRIINGKQQQVTERVVQKADGTVERHVESSGDDDFPQLDGQRQAALGWQQQQQQQQAQALPSATEEEQPKKAKSKKGVWPRRRKSTENNDSNKRKRRNSTKSNGA